MSRVSHPFALSAVPLLQLGGLVTLGGLPREVTDSPLQQVLVAFTVKPAWARHRYGFVEMKDE